MDRPAKYMTDVPSWAKFMRFRSNFPRLCVCIGVFTRKNKLKHNSQKVGQLGLIFVQIVVRNCRIPESTWIPIHLTIASQSVVATQYDHGQGL